MKKKILITGSSGFIGSKLCISLQKSNKYIIKKLKLSKKEFENQKFFKKYLIENYKKIDIVVHLGWGYMKDPWNIYHIKNNYNKTKTLFEFSKKNNVKKFIFCGSMNEYGDLTGSLKENRKPGEILTKYAISKSLLTNLGTNYFKKSDTHFYVIRPFYVYGYGQEKNSLINQLFFAAKNNKDISLSDCLSYRDYVYVYDVITAFIAIIKSNFNKPGIYNVGSGKSILLKTFVKNIWAKLNKNPKMLKFGNIKNKKEQIQLKSFSNNTKLKKTYSWKNKFDINQGINHMIREYKKHK